MGINVTQQVVFTGTPHWNSLLIHVEQHDHAAILILIYVIVLFCHICFGLPLSKKQND